MDIDTDDPAIKADTVMLTRETRENVIRTKPTTGSAAHDLLAPIYGWVHGGVRHAGLEGRQGAARPADHRENSRF
jgi:hypothetical protein